MREDEKLKQKMEKQNTQRKKRSRRGGKKKKKNKKNRGVWKAQSLINRKFAYQKIDDRRNKYTTADSKIHTGTHTDTHKTHENNDFPQ